MSNSGIIVGLSLLLASCTAAPDTDASGNVYPIACRVPLAELRTQAQAAGLVSIERIPPHTGPLAVFEQAMTVDDVNGAYLPLSRTIVLRDDWQGWRADDLERHELCHVIAGQWHGSNHPLHAPADMWAARNPFH